MKDTNITFFVDDFTRISRIFPMKNKFEAKGIFIKLYRLIENQFDKLLKTLHSDWGGEYRNFLPYLEEHGIHFRHQCPHTHQHNDKIE